MPYQFRLPGQPKKNPKTEFKPDPEKQFKGLGSASTKSTEVTKPEEPDQSARFDNLEQVEAAFKRGALEWPKYILVGNFRYSFYKSHSKGIHRILTGKEPGFVIYHLPKDNVSKAKEQGLNHWMVFVFTADNTSNMKPVGVGFTTAARGKAMYGGLSEDAQVVGDVVLVKIQLPTGVVSLKGKVDTGADISSLHVDGKPKAIGDTVRFENHNASGRIITAPLVTQQAVKSSDGGTEYRPIIELDIEVQGKPISKAQFNLNDRSDMEHEVLIGQNILEKAGFIVNPSRDGMQESEEKDLDELTEDEIIDMVSQLYEYMLEHPYSEE